MYIGATDDDSISGDEFSQGRGAQFSLVFLYGVAQFGSGAQGAQGQAGKVADAFGSQVTIGHFHTRLSRLPGLDHTSAELTRSRVVAEDAGIDMQQFHAGSPSEDRGWAIE
ncbi:hypothetical protein QF043_002967 [Pseudomonas sp. W3I7]|nr:hypothetical protein [Pseudomonas sp. W3I7]